MKKGFTLLELLAVIVVLAIIALIVTPFVTEAIENSRKGAFKSSVYGLKDAAELYCGQELTKNGGVFNGETFAVSNGELVSTTNPNNKLKFKGSSPVGESSVTISDDCQVTLNVTNGTYFASLEPGEVDVTITEEELASREQLVSSLEALTARVNTLENNYSSLSTSYIEFSNDVADFMTGTEFIAYNSAAIWDSTTNYLDSASIVANDTMAYIVLGAKSFPTTTWTVLGILKEEFRPRYSTNINITVDGNGRQTGFLTILVDGTVKVYQNTGAATTSGQGIKSGFYILNN